MAIGPQDYIDSLLVKKYSQEKVDNHDGIESMVNPEKMLAAMNDYSSVSRNMYAMSQKLTQACYSINAASAKYRKIIAVQAQA